MTVIMITDELTVKCNLRGSDIDTVPKPPLAEADIEFTNALSGLRGGKSSYLDKKFVQRSVTQLYSVQQEPFLNFVREASERGNARNDGYISMAPRLAQALSGSRSR